MISIIAAASENNVIGKENKIPWRLPADMRYFKSMTKGQVVVMGRKTYESLGKALAERVNIVITRDKNFHPKDAVAVSTVCEAFQAASRFPEKEIFIIGGGEIYRQTIDLADRVYLTRIHRHFDGDTYFPELSEDRWKMISKEDHQPDEKNPHPYSFITYERIR